MKKILFAIIMLSVVISCGNSDDAPIPEPAPLPEGETVITLGNLPDSIKVETSTEVKFTVFQEEHPEDFTISVDTVMPYYYNQILFDGKTGERVYLEKDKVYGTADMTLNGSPISQNMSITSGENILKISNPTVVGEYKMVLKITDKYQRTTTKEIKIKAFSPEIVVKFYDYFPGYDESDYFEMLNNKFTYSPLAEELKGFRVDTIYTREEPMHGYPGEWTVPGQGIVCYIGQDGGEDMQVFQTGSNLMIGKDGKPLSTTTWANRVDGETFNLISKQGFHGIMFATSTLTKVGSFYYTLRLVDKWGKEKMETIVYKAFGRTEEIPSHATPSDDSGSWWGHRIAD